MPVAILDVVDTAIKVGLGAMISAIATYQITHVNHSAAKKNELVKRKIDIIILSMEKVELYFSAYSTCISRIDGILRMGLPPGDFPPKQFERYRELDNALVAIRPDRAIAVSRLKIIGQFEAASLIEKTSSIERILRDKVIFDKKLPTREELIELSRKMSDLKKSIYEELSQAFDKVSDT